MKRDHLLRTRDTSLRRVSQFSKRTTPKLSAMATSASAVVSTAILMRPTTGSCESVSSLSSSHCASVCEGNAPELAGLRPRSVRCWSSWDVPVCLPTQSSSRQLRRGETSGIPADFRNSRKFIWQREHVRRSFSPAQQIRLSAQGQAGAEGHGIFRQDLDGTGKVPQSLPACPHGQLVARAGSVSGKSQSASQNWVCCCSEKDLNDAEEGGLNLDEGEGKPGVKYALVLLQFYKNEISPFLPGSCRYVPTCSVYAQEAYKKYGVWKGTILTIWRLSRCNPLGGTGFDPPRWFDEERPPSV